MSGAKYDKKNITKGLTTHLKGRWRSFSKQCDGRIPPGLVKGRKRVEPLSDPEAREAAEERERSFQSLAAAAMYRLSSASTGTF